MESFCISSKLCSVIKEMENFYKKNVKFWNVEKEIFLLKSVEGYGILDSAKNI